MENLPGVLGRFSYCYWEDFPIATAVVVFVLK